MLSNLKRLDYLYYVTKNLTTMIKLAIGMIIDYGNQISHNLLSITPNNVLLVSLYDCYKYNLIFVRLCLFSYNIYRIYYTVAQCPQQRELVYTYKRCKVRVLTKRIAEARLKTFGQLRSG